MRITVTQKMPAFGLFSMMLGACAVAAGYWSYTHLDHQFVWGGALLCTGFFAAFLLSLWNERLIIQVDKHGIFDRRLGVGLVLWKDVTDVQLFLEESHRYICVYVRNPEEYIRRLNGVRRAKMLHSQSLGFKGFNIDVIAMDVNIIQLKQLIDSFVRPYRS